MHLAGLLSPTSKHSNDDDDDDDQDHDALDGWL